MDFTTRVILHNFETLRLYDFIAWHFNFISLMEEQGVPIEEIIQAEDFILDLLPPLEY